MSLRRVVCAAIRAEDGSLLLGIRHYSADMHEQIRNRVDGEKFKHRHGDDQGFVDTWGNYLTREQAYLNAEFNNQIVRPLGCGFSYEKNAMLLYSEGLY